MVFPLVVLFGGVVHEHTHDSWSLLDFGFLVISLVAIIYSTKSANKNMARIMWGTFIMLSVSLLLRANFHWLEYVAYAASFGLIVTHLYNMYKGNSCEIPIGDRL